MDGDLAFKLAELGGQISDLGGAIRQLQRSGLDSASAQTADQSQVGQREGGADTAG